MEKRIIEKVLNEWKEHPACKKINEYGSIYHTRSYATPYEGETLPQFIERTLSESLSSLKSEIVKKVNKLREEALNYPIFLRNNSGRAAEENDYYNEGYNQGLNDSTNIIKEI